MRLGRRITERWLHNLRKEGRMDLWVELHVQLIDPTVN